MRSVTRVPASRVGAAPLLLVACTLWFLTGLYQYLNGGSWLFMTLPLFGIARRRRRQRGRTERQKAHLVPCSQGHQVKRVAAVAVSRPRLG